MSRRSTTMRTNDGIQNVLANIGTDRDKAVGTSYTLRQMNDVQLLTAYKSSGLVRKIIDKPAEDSARRWREWKADKEQISAIETEEKRLKIAATIIKARKIARLLGGCAIYMGTAGYMGQLDMPLNPRQMQRNGLRYLAIIPHRRLEPDRPVDDEMSPDFGQVTHYRMSRTSGQQPVRIHRSRLVVFHGHDDLTGADLMIDDLSIRGWGESVINSVIAEAERLDITMAGIASLVLEAKVDVLKIPNLTEDLADRGEEYEQLLAKRMNLAVAGKGINGMLVLDSEEEYEQKSATFNGLPELVDRKMLMLSAVARMPITVLFGQAPAGLNATGESDIRLYYDDIQAYQELGMGAEMHILDECVIRSALGSRPDEVFYNWRPLWQPSEKERAEIGERQAGTFKTLTETGAFDKRAIQKSAVNTLTESGSLVGLEEAVDEFGEVPPEPVVNAGNGPQPNEPVIVGEPYA